MADNKVKFGLKNVHIAYAAQSGWDTPIAIPGAVNLTLDAAGNQSDFYADDSKYYSQFKNDGYTGTLEMAIFPDEVKAVLLGWYSDEDGIVEDADGVVKKFALMYEVNGDQQKRRFVDYECEISRPSVNAATTEDSNDPQTDTVNLTVVPHYFADLQKNIVSKSVKEDSDAYSSFFSAVLVPKAADEEEDEPSVTVSPSRTGIAVNGSKQLNAVTVPADAEITWSSSSTSVATVDEHGLVTGAGAGTATITATITVDGTDYTDTCSVTVSAS